MYPSIVLLNFEGPVLTAYRNDSMAEDGLFLIVDQWKNPIAFLNKEQFENFLIGEFSVIDSDGRAWNYPVESSDARPGHEKLIKFVNDDE
jgi:hypothetical protein